MQHIKTLAVAPNESATGSTRSQEKMQQKTEFPKTWISALFKRFQAIYGHKFTSTIDGIEPLAVREWSVALSGLTGAQIKSGIDRCLTRAIKPGEQDWPPTPAEFRRLCLPEKMPAYHRDYIALPRPPHDPEKIEASFRAMREALL